MKNLMKKIRKSNKGFTLVELIIVVAIIAILSAVVAPQYIKYVEKSRGAADADSFGSVIQAVNVLVADGKITSTTTFTVGNDGSVKIGTSDATDVTDLTGTIPAFKSSDATTATKTVTATISGGVAEVTFEPDDYVTAWVD